MNRQWLVAAGVAAVLIVAEASPAGAWVGGHVGYTHVGPAGVSHYGRTAVATPYGYRSYGTAGYAGVGGVHGYSYGYGYRAPVPAVRPVVPVAPVRPVVPVSPVRPVVPVAPVYGAGVYRRY